jgi:hypothetical protein
MLAGWLRTGGWFTMATDMVKLRETLSLFAVAVTEAGKMPLMPGGGATWMFAVRVLPTCGFDVRVMKVGPCEKNMIASPSGSLALIVWSAVDPEQPPVVTVMFAMGSRNGGVARAGSVHAALEARTAIETTSSRIKIALFIGHQAFRGCALLEDRDPLYELPFG